ncbi:hypothetical protein ACFWU3_18885 [Streptomyces sp. NPDC058685]|uniref:hypothetical protein n=1 Tax=Streptomyces sp. NPDC058685 TaxID=3346598 RepID=UPI003660E572
MDTHPARRPRSSRRRTESGTPPEAARGNSPDGWDAMMTTWDHLADHRVSWTP